jgi:NAD(P)-dependent dehydrogenase (short-subunit alcohol dehydrogenase family)
VVDDETRRRQRHRVDAPAAAVNRVAVVTGANRGIGLEVTRQLAVSGDTVFLGTRQLDSGERAARPIIAAGGDVVVRRLDVTDPTTLDVVAAELADVHGRLDILVNNAAIHYDTWQQAVSADLNTVREALDTNLLGAWRAVHAFVPLLRRSRHGRVVNVSSEAGSLSSMGGGTPAYSISKAALNAFTRVLAAELGRDRILVNSVCPGWVATNMGGPGGRPVTEGRCQHHLGDQPPRPRAHRRVLPRRPTAAMVKPARGQSCRSAIPRPFVPRRRPRPWETRTGAEMPDMHGRLGSDDRSFGAGVRCPWAR